MIAALLLAVTASAGCGVSPPSGGGAGTTKTWTTAANGITDGDGTSRSFDVEVPAGYVNNTPVPVIFIYHEAGGTPANVRSLWGFTAAAGSAAILIEPQGILWQGLGPGWDGACAAGGPALPGFSAGTGRDVAWTDSILTWIGNNYCVDLDKVYAAGFSWGADMAMALSCCRGNKFAGVAIASATDEFTTAGNATTYINYPCSSPTPVYWTHDASYADSAYPDPAFTTTLVVLRTMNGCTTSFTTASSCNTYTSCSSGRATLDCNYTALGHNRPPGWAGNVWAWFQTQARSSGAAPTSTKPTRYKVGRPAPRRHLPFP